MGQRLHHLHWLLLLESVTKLSCTVANVDPRDEFTIICVCAMPLKTSQKQTQTLRVDGLTLFRPGGDICSE